MISSSVIIRVSCKMSDNSLALVTDDSLTPPSCICYCIYYCICYCSARPFYLEEIEPERLPGLALPGKVIYSLSAMRVRLMMSSLTFSCSESE